MRKLPDKQKQQRENNLKICKSINTIVLLHRTSVGQNQCTHIKFTRDNKWWIRNIENGDYSEKVVYYYMSQVDSISWCFGK